MRDAQEHARGDLSAGTLTEPERTRLKDELIEMRQATIVNKASGAALILGVLTFLFLGKLGLTLAMILGLATGAIVYAVKKGGLEQKALPPVAGYDDERLQTFHTQAMLEQVAMQKRSNVARGALVFVAIVLVIVWIVARIQH